MCTREMTLGEEIINLVGKGIDVPTVERMYRKYIGLNANEEARQACEEDSYNTYKDKLKELKEFYVKYCKDDVESLVRNSNTFLPDDISEGYQIEIPLGHLGTFTATAQVITEDKVLFLFDNYVAKRPMNKNGSNAGGYNKSDLKKWIDTELYKMFPEVLRNRMSDLTIPTVGEIYGWVDKWNCMYFEHDDYAQLPLMKQRRTRVSYYNNECECGWLRNAIKKEFSSSNFSFVKYNGDTNSTDASISLGVRPEFWLVR